MKEMVYKPKRKMEVLFSGNYLNHKFAILSLGSHPTAYIECKIKDCSNYDDIRLDTIAVHGGFTFFDRSYWSDDETLYLGWDYGHLCDFAGWMIGNCEFEDECLKKWTTSEIYEEVKHVIEQMIDLYTKLEDEKYK